MRERIKCSISWTIYNHTRLIGEEYNSKISILPEPHSLIPELVINSSLQYWKFEFNSILPSQRIETWMRTLAIAKQKGYFLAYKILATYVFGTFPKRKKEKRSIGRRRNTNNKIVSSLPIYPAPSSVLYRRLRCQRIFGRCMVLAGPVYYRSAAS